MEGTSEMVLLVVLSKVVEGTLRMLGLLVLSIYPLVYIRFREGGVLSSRAPTSIWWNFELVYRWGLRLLLAGEGSGSSFVGMGSDWSWVGESSGWS